MSFMLVVARLADTILEEQGEEGYANRRFAITFGANRRSGIGKFNSDTNNSPSNRKMGDVYDTPSLQQQ
jgi:hypothetical protein